MNLEQNTDSNRYSVNKRIYGAVNKLIYGELCLGLIV